MLKNFGLVNEIFKSEEIDEMLLNAEEKTFQQSEYIFRAHTNPQYIFAITRGTVCERVSDTDKNAIFNIRGYDFSYNEFYGIGEVVGITSVFNFNTPTGNTKFQFYSFFKECLPQNVGATCIRIPISIIQNILRRVVNFSLI